MALGIQIIRKGEHIVNAVGIVLGAGASNDELDSHNATTLWDLRYYSNHDLYETAATFC
jgi:hypothetical protein